MGSGCRILSRVSSSTQNVMAESSPVSSHSASELLVDDPASFLLFLCFLAREEAAIALLNHTDYNHKAGWNNELEIRYRRSEMQ